jgi:hypothetical protein
MRKERLEQKVQKLIAEIRQTSEDYEIPETLSLIARTLERIAAELQSPNPNAQSLLEGVGAIGYIVTDHCVLRESPLGTKLLEILDEVVYQYDPRFRQSGGPNA